MAVFNEQRHAFEFIVSQAAGYRSFEEVALTVPSETTYEPGTVLGQITGGNYVRYNPGASDGSEVVAGVLCTTASETGNYTVLKRDAEVERDALTYSDGANAAQITAQQTALAGLGIVTRAPSVNVT